MAWSLHTPDPVSVADLRASLQKAQDVRLRADERSRILAGEDTDEAAVEAVRQHMDRAIDAACVLADAANGKGGGKHGVDLPNPHLVHVSLSGDRTAEGIHERTSVSVDAQTLEK
jgi:hypothetical protein